jgi:hypothetical protein
MNPGCYAMIYVVAAAVVVVTVAFLVVIASRLPSK